MGRAPCCEKMGLKKGPWTPQEDKILIDHIEKYGHSNWRALPKQSGLLRCGKSCRLRWTNYLRPDIKRGNFAKEEEETIIKLHEMMGNRWSAIAAKLPGRTDNEIKNVWHTHLKKRAHNNKCSKSETTMNSSSINTCQEFDDQNSPSTYSSSTMSSSPQQSSSSSDFSSVTSDSSIFNQHLTIEATNINGIMDEEEDMMGSFEIDESFWSEELSSSSVDENSSMISDFISSSTTDDQSRQLQFPAHDSIEPIFDYDLDYWYSLFIGSGGLPELPEF